jgi:hypothetical protein
MLSEGRWLRAVYGVILRRRHSELSEHQPGRHLGIVSARANFLQTGGSKNCDEVICRLLGFSVAHASADLDSLAGISRKGRHKRLSLLRGKSSWCLLLAEVRNIFLGFRKLSLKSCHLLPAASFCVAVLLCHQGFSGSNQLVFPVAVLIGRTSAATRRARRTIPTIS